MKTKIVILCIALTLFSITAFANTQTKEYKKTIDFRSFGDIYVKSINGNIEVESWDKDKVDIYAEIVVKDRSRADALKLLDMIKIDVKVDKNSIRIIPDYPQKKGGSDLWDWIFGSNNPPVINFKIKVPGNTNPELESMNGNILVEKINGNTRVGTVNGGINIDKLSGSVDAHTTNGSIKATFNIFDKQNDIQLRTINGSIRIKLPDEVQAFVKASTVNGNIKTDFPLTVKGKILKKNVRGLINGGGGNIGLSTVNGSVNIFKQ